MIQKIIVKKDNNLLERVGIGSQGEGLEEECSLSSFSSYYWNSRLQGSFLRDETWIFLED